MPRSSRPTRLRAQVRWATHGFAPRWGAPARIATVAWLAAADRLDWRADIAPPRRSRTGGGACAARTWATPTRIRNETNPKPVSAWRHVAGLPWSAQIESENAPDQRRPQKQMEG